MISSEQHAHRLTSKGASCLTNRHPHKHRNELTEHRSRTINLINLRSIKTRKQVLHVLLCAHMHISTPDQRGMLLHTNHELKNKAI